jgi:hypothetical protein
MCTAACAAEAWDPQTRRCRLSDLLQAVRDVLMTLGDFERGIPGHSQSRARATARYDRIRQNTASGDEDPASSSIQRLCVSASDLVFVTAILYTCCINSAWYSRFSRSLQKNLYQELCLQFCHVPANWVECHISRISDASIFRTVRCVSAIGGSHAVRCQDLLSIADAPC